MPKTDIKKIQSEDVKELTDEALDRAAGTTQACPGCHVCVHCLSPAE